MKITLLTPISGSSGSYASGSQYECSEEEAKRFIDAGLAESIDTKTTKKKTTKKAAKK